MEDPGGADVAEFCGVAASAGSETTGDTTARASVRQAPTNASAQPRGFRDANTAIPYSFEGPELGTTALVTS